MAHFCKLLICSFATTSDKSAVVYSSHYISLILSEFLLKLKYVLFRAFNCFLLWLLHGYFAISVLYIPLLVIILFDFFPLFSFSPSSLPFYDNFQRKCLVKH